MSIALGGGKSVLAVTLIETTCDQELILFHQPRSKCYFAEDIVHGQYIIALRIDLGDLQDGEPTMDADVYQNVNGERGKPLKDKKRQWHHTKLSSASADCRCYDFEFKGLRLRLIAQKTFTQTVMIDCIVTAPDPGC
jgi:hypothetical protein